MATQLTIRETGDGFLVTADARKVSPQSFLDAITGRSPEVRAAERQQMLDSCKAAIRRGDTYGWPPAMVAECRRDIDRRVRADLASAVRF